VQPVNTVSSDVASKMTRFWRS